MTYYFIGELLIGISSALGLAIVSCYIGRRWGSFSKFFLEILEKIEHKLNSGC
jgi:hypothetical protein